LSLYNIFFNDFLFNFEDILGAKMDPVNKPYPNLPIPIDKKRIKITEPLEGSMSAFIIIKTDNAKVPTENNIKPIMPFNIFIYCNPDLLIDFFLYFRESCSSFNFFSLTFLRNNISKSVII